MLIFSAKKNDERAPSIFLGTKKNQDTISKVFENFTTLKMDLTCHVTAYTTTIEYMYNLSKLLWEKVLELHDIQKQADYLHNTMN